ncbi:hypothetical protein V6N13_105136 [Hibiscus sabdariffa]
MHLLDKRSTRALPVALMIHDNSTDRTALVAGDASIQISALSTFDVKKLVVGPRVGRPVRLTVSTGLLVPYCRRCAPGLNWPGRSSGAVTLKKLECSKQGLRLYTLAWDNITGF